MDKEQENRKQQAAEAFARIYGIIARLRAPDGCPWDREQTPETLRATLIEEAYELVEAINEKDAPHVKEELGDNFLQEVLISYIYEQEEKFSVAEVLDLLGEKLIRRHPHVFGEVKVNSADEVVKNWKEIKEKVEGRRKKDSLLDEVSKSLPPLDRAYRLQKKAAKAGFDWTEIDSVWEKAFEELDEARHASTSGDHGHLEEELGDLLFSVVNLSRFLKVDPSLALQRTSEKFSRRFRHVEDSMKNLGKTLGPEEFTLMDKLWDEAKASERKS